MTRGDGIFDANVAATYDSLHGGSDTADVARMVDVLEWLAAGGAALEFAIGTGRVALPLAARGVRVAGIEISAAMAAVLAGKPGGAAIDVALGDMTQTRVPGAFALVYLVYNTLDNLTTQEAQVACFENAARHLAPGGRFVVETLVPPLQKIPFGENAVVSEQSDGHRCVDTFDVVTQAYASHHTWDGKPPLTVPFRYAWPAELDLMARIAGMKREARWADWARGPFTATSTRHVSVWRKTSGLGGGGKAV